jgi:hypothetical protein
LVDVIFAQPEQSAQNLLVVLTKEGRVPQSQQRLAVHDKGQPRQRSKPGDRMIDALERLPGDDLRMLAHFREIEYGRSLYSCSR